MSSERKAEAKESRFVSQRKECRGYSEHKEKPDEDSDLPKLDCVLYIEPMLCLKSWQEGGESKMSLSRSEQLNEKQGLWSSSILLPPQLSISKSARTLPVCPLPSPISHRHPSTGEEERERGKERKRQGH